MDPRVRHEHNQPFHKYCYKLLITFITLYFLLPSTSYSPLLLTPLYTYNGAYIDYCVELRQLSCVCYCLCYCVCSSGGCIVVCLLQYPPAAPSL